MPADEPVVWIPKGSSHTFDAALKYGPLRYVYDPIDSVFNVQELFTKARRVLLDYTPTDHLLLNGPVIMNSVVFAVLIQVMPSVNLLLFHAKLEQYLERTVTNGRSD